MKALLLCHDGKNDSVAVYFDPKNNVVQVNGNPPTTEDSAAIKNLLTELSDTVTTLVGAWDTDGRATEFVDNLVKEVNNREKRKERYND
ncbi:MAG: hypothetical protein [Caudoviricetes sp.]|nr:MAG: hypothetical protein [Caudoviricetes sp.]